MPQIRVAGHGVVNFPDGTPPEEMQAALDAQFGQSAQPPAMAPLPEPPSAAGFGRNVVDSALNTGVGLVTGLPKLAMQMVTDPKGAGKTVVEGIGDRAKQVWNDPLGTMYTDPVGLAADVGGVMSLGKMGLRGLTAGQGVAEAAGRVAAENTAKASAAEAGSALRQSSQRTATSAVPDKILPAGGFSDAPVERPRIQTSTAASAPVVDRILPAGGWGNPGAGSGTGGWSAPAPKVSIEAAQQGFGKDPGFKKAVAADTPSPTVAPKAQWPPEHDSLDWHSGAEPGTPEAEQMSSLHREEAVSDSNYRRRLMDERGSVGLDLVTGAALEYALRKMVTNPTIRAGVKAPIKSVGKLLGGAASSMAEPGLDMAVIGRLMKDDGK